MSKFSWVLGYSISEPWRCGRTPGHVLVYLHEAYDLSVESCSCLVDVETLVSTNQWNFPRMFTKHGNQKLGL